MEDDISAIPLDEHVPPCRPMDGAVLSCSVLISNLITVLEESPLKCNQATDGQIA